MFLAWVEVAEQPRCMDVRANVDAAPRHRALVEMKFDGLDEAQAWASRQLVERVDATGHAAVFETSGPFIRLQWESDEVEALAAR